MLKNRLKLSMCNPRFLFGSFPSDKLQLQNKLLQLFSRKNNLHNFCKFACRNIRCKSDKKTLQHFLFHRCRTGFRLLSFLLMFSSARRFFASLKLLLLRNFPSSTLLFPSDKPHLQNKLLQLFSRRCRKKMFCFVCIVPASFSSCICLTQLPALLFHRPRINWDLLDLSKFSFVRRFLSRRW